MEVAIVIVALIVYMGFRQWLKHQRRAMIHQERLLAVEKGVELPPLEIEIQRSGWNVQRVLLLAGLCWISLGVGAFAVLQSMLAYPSPATRDLPYGVQWIGLAPVAIGLSHLIVYFAGKNKER